jgi:TrfA protein
MNSQEPKPSQRIQDIQERCLEMREIERERESAQVIQLPLWPESKRGSPNSFARSALFAAIKKRKFVKNALIFSQQNFSVKFTGEQLNQEDMTVWLTLVDLARKHPLGTECSFTAYGILKHMGLAVGKTGRDVLEDNVRRLTACMVEIETSKLIYGGSLIDDFVIDKDTKRYKITLNKKLINIFGENDWTALNWEQRKKLRNKPLALSLHEYYSTHEFPKPLTVEFLYNKTGSTNSDRYGFKRDLKKALEEIIKIGFLESYSVEGNLVTVKRVYKAPASQKYLGG